MILKGVIFYGRQLGTLDNVGDVWRRMGDMFHHQQISSKQNQLNSHKFMNIFSTVKISMITIIVRENNGDANAIM